MGDGAERGARGGVGRGRGGRGQVERRGGNGEGNAAAAAAARRGPPRRPDRTSAVAEDGARGSEGEDEYDYAKLKDVPPLRRARGRARGSGTGIG